MCQLSKKTYDGCGHKGKTICLDICNGCKRDGIDYTCTDVKNRKIEHQWIDGKCYGCRGVDPPASEQADTSDDEYDQDMERLGVSKGLSRYPHPPNGKPYRKGPELARPNGSSRKPGPDDAFSRAPVRCPDVDPPASEQDDTSDDEYDQDMERLGVSKGLSRYPHPPNGQPYRKAPDLGKGIGSRGKSRPDDAVSRAPSRCPDVDRPTAKEESDRDDEFCKAIDLAKLESNGDPHPPNVKPYRIVPEFVKGGKPWISLVTNGEGFM